MIEKIDLNNEHQVDEIKNYIKLKKESTIFNTAEWLKVLADTYHYNPSILVNKKDGKITACISSLDIKSIFTGRRMVSLPFSTYSGFLCDNNGALKEIEDFLKEEAKKENFKYIEIKQSSKINSSFEEKEHYFNDILDLGKTEDELLKSFDKGTARWGIKKAQKSGIIVKEENNLEGYKKFYDLMLETRKLQGSPPYPLSLFKNILNYLKENSQLFLAYHENIPIAGLVLFYFNKAAHYMYGASLKKKEYLQYQPNNLLIWEAIKFSKKAGCEKFDFGITPPAHSSLLQFKSRWGTEEKKLPYYFYLNKIKKIPLYDSSRFGIGKKIWKIMPKFIIRAIGPIILRNFG